MPKTPVRREGFVGQHLVVLPAPIRRSAAQHTLLKGLLVTDAGYFPTAEGHRVERPQGAATHLLILCLEGKGWVRSEGRTAPIAKGEIVWLPADQPHAYGAAEDHPWRILWAHFQGDEVSAWQRELGWAAKTPFGEYHFSSERIGTLGLDKVYAILESGYSIQHLLAASTALRGVFCAILERMAWKGAEKTAEERTASVREEILSNPEHPHRLSDLASSAGLSVPHFCALFRRQTGFTPIDFVIRERIRRACQLLDRTQDSIANVAAEVGINDPYYFSRCFHRIMGISPRAYRKHIKG